MEDKTTQDTKAMEHEFNPKNRDFQRTEEDIDNISKSEKEELEKRKERTHFASTKPDKDHVG